MENLTVFQGAQLPDTIEDVAKFITVNKSRLAAYQNLLKDKNLLEVQEFRMQKLKEGQEIGAALLAGEMRMGEFLSKTPKASGGDRRSEDFKIRGEPNFEKSKSEIISEMGYSKDEVSDYQRMAKNPEIVQRVIDEAIARGEIATKTQVLKEIKAARDEEKRLAEAEAKRQAEQAKREAEEAQKALEKAEAQLDELKAREPEPVIVEVIPDEYKMAKREADALRRDLATEQGRYSQQQKRVLELEDELKELKMATSEGLDMKNLNENVIYFCTTCNNFIGNVGGLVWLTSRIADMPEKERNLFIKAACSFRDWAQAFIGNLERAMDEQRTDYRRGLLPGKGSGVED